MRPVSADHLATQPGARIGTPAFMSPEQAEGRLYAVGRATDIYGLGATLYSVLTGRAPVEGKNQGEVMRKAACGEWLPPSQVKKAVPKALEAVCRKAMALKPEDRYTSAIDLVRDIERWLAGEAVSVFPTPWAVRSRRWLDRQRTRLLAVLACVLITVGGLILLIVAARNYNEAIRPDPMPATAFYNRGNAWLQPRRSTTRPSRTTTRPSASTPRMRWPSTTAATPGLARRSTTRQSQTSARPSPSTPQTPRPIATSAPPWPTRRTWTGPSPSTARPSNSTPRPLGAYNNRGNALLGKKEYDEAIADCDAAIALDPKLAFAYRIRGNAWSAKGEHDKAKQDYDEANRLTPK